MFWAELCPVPLYKPVNVQTLTKHIKSGFGCGRFNQLFLSIVLPRKMYRKPFPWIVDIHVHTFYKGCCPLNRLGNCCSSIHI